MRGHRSPHRVAAALLAAGVALCAVPAVASTPVPVAEQSKAETKLMADVKVEIRQESGNVVKGAATVDWNEDGSLSIEADGTKHDLNLRIDREGNSKKVSITLAYARGGEDIIAPYTFDAKVKKREILRVEGNLAIAVTVTPKKVKVEAPKEKKPRVNVGDDPDDPLAGLD
ncbi:MAG: hypothetical protein AAGA54_34255 [Myxococcota bacterium]